MTGKATRSPSFSQSLVVERDRGWAAGLAARMRMMRVKMRMKPTEAVEKAGGRGRRREVQRSSGGINLSTAGVAECEAIRPHLQ